MSYQIIDLKNKAELNKLISRIETKLSLSVKSYASANDSEIPEKERVFYEARYQRLTDEMEKILSYYDIKCMWAGLYCVYIKQDGKQEHDLRRALVE